MCGRDTAEEIVGRRAGIPRPGQKKAVRAGMRASADKKEENYAETDGISDEGPRTGHENSKSIRKK